MGEFVDFIRGAGSPTQQLKLIASFKPQALGVPEEAWDAAVYATLDRAAMLKRMGKAAEGPESVSATVASTSSNTSTSGASHDKFHGPTALLVSRDRLGRAFVDASRGYLANSGETVHMPLETRHTECLMNERGRQVTSGAIGDAVEALLQRLG